MSQMVQGTGTRHGTIEIAFGSTRIVHADHYILATLTWLRQADLEASGMTVTIHGHRDDPIWSVTYRLTGVIIGDTFELVKTAENGMRLDNEENPTYPPEVRPPIDGR